MFSLNSTKKRNVGRRGKSFPCNFNGIHTQTEKWFQAGSGEKAESLFFRGKAETFAWLFLRSHTHAPDPHSVGWKADCRGGEDYVRLPICSLSCWVVCQGVNHNGIYVAFYSIQCKRLRWSWQLEVAKH